MQTWRKTTNKHKSNPQTYSKNIAPEPAPEPEPEHLPDTLPDTCYGVLAVVSKMHARVLDAKLRYLKVRRRWERKKHYLFDEKHSLWRHESEVKRDEARLALTDIELMVGGKVALGQVPGQLALLAVVLHAARELSREPRRSRAHNILSARPR